MTTPRRWYVVVRRPAGDGPLGVERHLGLGAEQWPRSPGDEAMQEAVEAAMVWHPVPTLYGVEWVALVTDRAVVDAFHRHAASGGCDVVTLRLGLEAGPGSLGWDLGRPAGGHSVIPHELGLAPFAAEAPGWLNAAGLFTTRAAAEAFWATRQRSCAGHPEWETPSAWAIVHVGRVDGEAGEDETGEDETVGSDEGGG